MVNDIKDICTTSKDIRHIESRELAAILKYDNPTGGAYYRRTGSLTCYGLIKYKGSSFQVTELGENIAYGTGNDDSRRQLYNQAIMNVDLWKELNDRFRNRLPDNLRGHLKNIADIDTIDPKYEELIRKRYLEDIVLLTEPQEMAAEEQKSYKTPSISTQQLQLSQDTPGSTTSNSIGKISVDGVGSITVTDQDSFEAADMLFKIISKRVRMLEKKDKDMHDQYSQSSSEN